MTGRLTSAQLEALSYVKQAAGGQYEKSKTFLSEVLLRNHVNEAVLENAIHHIRLNARVVLHFHPDRLDASSQSVAESLLQSGLYRNQFETGLSNGGLTAFHGGERDNWEKRMFGGAYQKETVAAAERPKYGALDLMNYADGASPRFGSCYFRLSQEASQRCSFTSQDSVNEPDMFGTLDDLEGILATLLDQVEKQGGILGARDITIPDLLVRFSHIKYQSVNYSAHYGRTLDDYIEAQVHGPVDLKLDVETLVADPSFQTTETGQTLDMLCKRYDVDLDWHAGFKVHASDIPDEFRGPKIPLLARQIAGKGFLNTAMIGNAAVSLVRQPELWSDWGTFAETRQYLKQLWHALAYYGQPLV